MTEFWDKPAEKSGKVLAAFLEGLPLGRQPPPVSSVLYGIITERRSILAAQLLLREKSGA